MPDKEQTYDNLQDVVIPNKPARDPESFKSDHNVSYAIKEEFYSTEDLLCYFLPETLKEATNILSILRYEGVVYTHESRDNGRFN